MTNFVKNNKSNKKQRHVPAIQLADGVSPFVIMQIIEQAATTHNCPEST
uniref:Uncharacterized protein n=1 Tax=Glossina palpalis gambiensis TaxID=67801 RepID=A0A1B0AZ57_9MUSC